MSGTKFVVIVLLLILFFAIVNSLPSPKVAAIECKYGTLGNGDCKVPGWLHRTICPALPYGTIPASHNPFCS